VDATKPERPTKRGKQVRGLKTCFVMGRSPDPHGRVLLDFDHCPKDEMGFALASVAQMAPRLPGLQGVVWDGAGRGTHASQLGRHSVSISSAPSPRAWAATPPTRPPSTSLGVSAW
jgi:hypothetical protein